MDDCEDAVATSHSRSSAAEIPAVLTQSQSAHSSSSAAESTSLSLNWKRILWRVGAAQFPTASIAEVPQGILRVVIEKLGHLAERLVASEIGLDDRAHNSVCAFNHFLGRQDAYKASAARGGVA